MQRNFALFLVLSFGILLGWMALVAYLRPVGTLEITVPDGLDRDNVEIVAKSDGAERKLSLKAEDDGDGKTIERQLMSGEYELTLSGKGSEGWRLSKARVQFTKEKLTDAVEIAKRPEPKKPEVAQVPPGEKPGDKPTPPAAEPPGGEKPPQGIAEKVNRQRLAVGSIQPDSPYRLLVTFDNRGAVVERIELASHRYRDLEDDSGYLGHLSPTDAANGAVVGVVGMGTPANAAGIKPGDIIVKLAGQEVAGADAIEGILAETRPDEEIEIAILRDGKPATLRATLDRHPMQIVRPEIENRRHRRESPEPPNRGIDDQLSYLVSLTKVGEEKLDGVDLSSVEWRVAAHDEKSVEFEHTLDKLGLKVTKRFELAALANGENENVDARAYHLTLKITIEQLTDGERRIAYRLDGPTGLPTEGWWYSRLGMRDYFVGPENDDGERTGFFPMRCVDVAKRPDESDWVRRQESVAFVGVNAQYFAAAVLPKHDEKITTRPILVGDVMKAHENLTNITCQIVTEPRTLVKKGDKIVHEYELFAGPKRPDLLGEYDLRQTIDYGWWVWAWIARFLQGVLHTFHALVGNYGLAILMLTVMVRLAMFPLSRKQVLGAMKMQELQPEMKRINEMYKKDLEARNRALSQLFRKHNYHPLSGCLPIFIQLPIFIGLYNSLSVDIELRQAPLIPGLAWCSNLAAPDMLYDWSGWMPNFVINGGLWGMLPPAMGPFLNVLPIITVSLMIVQQKLFTPPPTNEQAEMQQKIMKYMMVVMCFLFYKVASGLCLYFICSSTWGLAERKLMPKPAPKTEGETAPASVAVKPKPATNGSTAKNKNKNKKRQKGR